MFTNARNLVVFCCYLMLFCVLRRTLRRKSSYNNYQEATAVKRLQRTFCTCSQTVLVLSGVIYHRRRNHHWRGSLPHHGCRETPQPVDASDAIVKFIANQEGFCSSPQVWRSLVCGLRQQIKEGQYVGGISREKAMRIAEGAHRRLCRVFGWLPTEKHILVTEYEYDAILSLAHNLNSR